MVGNRGLRVVYNPNIESIRLARYFNMSPQFWLGLQIDYDLDIAEDEMGEQIA